VILIEKKEKLWHRGQGKLTEREERQERKENKEKVLRDAYGEYSGCCDVRIRGPDGFTE